MASSRLPSSTSSSSGIVQYSSPSKTKYSSPRQVRPFLDEVGRPGPEVLDAPDLDVGRVDVDPVVREAGLLGDDQGDGEEVAVVQVVRRLDAPRSGTGGSMARSRAVIGIEDITAEHGYSVSVPSADSPTTATALPPAWRILVTLVFMRTLVPAASTRSRQRSHIIPGPYLGYWNSSMSEVISFWLRLGSTALTIAFDSDRFLIRWAAQSACNSGRRDAPHLLGVGLEEVPVEAVPEPGRRPTPRSWSGPSAAGSGPRRRTSTHRVASTTPRFLRAFMALSGIVVVLAVVVDPAHPGPHQEVARRAGSRATGPPPAGPW